MMKSEGNRVANVSFARLPVPPYYSVIFCSQRSADDGESYAEMAERMVELASSQPGFLGVESARDAQGFGITVSYWASLDAIMNWKANAEHKVAQETGKALWYDHYELRIARVERAYSRNRKQSP